MANGNSTIGGTLTGSVQEDTNVTTNGTAPTHTISTSGTVTATDPDGPANSFQAETVQGQYGTFVLSASGAWTYTADDDQAAIQQLNQNATLSEDFVFNTIDNTAGTVHITIKGTNDAPVIDSAHTTATGSVTEAGVDSGGNAVTGPATATGTLTSTDIDTGHTTTWSGNAAGTYGAFAINASTGVWTYTLDNSNTATNALAQGATATETFTATVTDDNGATATQVVTVTIHGTDDAPVVTTTTANAAGSVTEAGYNVAGAPDTGGQLAATDVDRNPSDTLTYAANSTNGTYGTFAVTSSGAWTYHLDDSRAATQALTSTDTKVETFSYTVSDGKGGTATQTVAVTVHGTNDGPVAQAASNSATENGAVVTGAVHATDVDDTSGILYRINTAVPGLLFNDDGTYSFDPNNPAYDKIQGGQSQTITASYTAIDPSGATSDSTLTITVTGTNDAPVISTGSTLTGSVQESGVVTTNGTTTAVAGTDHVSGQVTATDADTYPTADTLTYTANGGTTSGANSTIAGIYGNFSINTSTGAWTYALDNSKAATQALNEGQTASETFPVTVNDGHSGTASATVTINVTGTNDAPIAVADGANSANAVTIGFDSFPDDQSGSSPPVTTNGFTFTGTHFHVIDPTTRAIADDGTARVVYTEVGQPVTMVKQGGGAFTLTSFDLGEYAYDSNGGVRGSFTITGTKADGTTVTQTITLDGIADGPGGQDDYQHINLSNFDNVTSVQFGAPGQNFAIDNIVLNGGVIISTTENASVTADVLANDVDVDADGATKTLTTASVATGSGTVSIANNKLVFNPGTDFDHLNAGATQNVVVTYTMADAHGATSSSTATITVTGTNDAPVFSGASMVSGSVAEAGVQDGGNTATNGTATATGQLVTTDADDTHTAAYTVVGNGAGTYGTFSVNSSTGVWTYNLDNSNAATNALAQGETHDETFTVTVTDDKGATATQLVTVHVTGTNDAPVIDSAHTTATGSVTEAGIAADGTTAVTGPATTGGTVASTDVDHGATAAYSVANSGAGTYGTFAIDSSGHWTYALDNTKAATQALGAGQTGTDTITATVTDDHGATATQTLTVTVNGTNDAPTVTATTLTGGNAAYGAVYNTNGDFSAGLTGYTADTTVTSTSGFSGTHIVLLDNSGGFITGDTSAVELYINGDVNDADGHAPGDTAHGPTLTSNAFPAAAGADVTVVYRLSANGDTAVGTAYLLNTVTGVKTSIFNYAQAPNGDGNGTGVTGDTGVVTALATVPTAGTYQLVFQVGTFDSTYGGYVGAVLEIGTASVQAHGVSEDIPFTYSNGTAVLLANASDVDANDQGNLTVSNVSATSTHGATITYDPTAGTLKIDATQSSDAQALKAGETLTDTFTYQVNDAHGGHTAATATYTLVGVNDAPVITNNAAAATGSVTEAGSSGNGTATPTVIPGTPTATGTLTSSDVDHGATATWSVVGSGAGTYGNLTVTSGSLAGGSTWTYTIDQTKANALSQGEAHDETFTVKVTDDQGATATETVTVHVTGTNDAPVVSGAVMATVSEGGTGSTLDALANASDVDHGTTLSVTNVPTAGNLPAGVTYDAASHSFSIDPTNVAYDHLALGDQTTVTVNYSVSDGITTTPASVTWTVTGTNDAPTLTGGSLGTLADTSAPSALGAQTGTITGNDVDDHHTLTYSAGAVSATLNGNATTTSYGSFTIDPTTGAYSFTPVNSAIDALKQGDTVTVSVPVTTTDENHASSAPATYTFTITGTNDAPVVMNDTNTATEGSTTAVTGSVAGNDTDPDGGPLAYTVQTGTTPPAGLTLFSDGSYTFDATNAAYNNLQAGATRDIVLNYQVSDGNGGLGLGKLTITVTGTDDAPSFTNGAHTFNGIADTAATGVALNSSGTIAGSATDPDTSPMNDTLTYSAGSPTVAQTGGASTTANYGTLALNADGTYNFTGNASAIDALKANQSVTLSYNVTVDDGHQMNATTPFTLTITGTNDTPVISSSAPNVSLTETNAALTQTGAVTATDGDSDPLTYSVGTATITPTGVTLSASEMTAIQNAFTFNSASAGGWTFNLASPDYLGRNDSITVTYPLTVSDGTASATQTATFVIHGSEDAPVATTAATAITISEAGDASNQSVNVGNAFTFTDADRTDTLTPSLSGVTITYLDASGVAHTLDPTLQTAIMNGLTVSDTDGSTTDNHATATVSLSFSGNLDFLSVGEKLQIGYTVNASDGISANDAHVTGNTITINGTNDAPVLTGMTLGTYTDTAASDTFSPISGTIVATDKDRADTPTYAVASSSSSDGNPTSTYGAFTLDAQGHYTFTPTAAAINALQGGTVTLSYVVNADDHHGGVTPATFQVVIGGANDTPILATTGLTFAATDDNQTTDTVNLLTGATDVDTGSHLSATNLQVTVTSASLTAAQITAAQNDLNMASHLNNDGTFTFNPSNDFDPLDLGQTATVSYSYDVSDGLGGTVHQTGSLIVNGALETGVGAGATPNDDTLNGTQYGDYIDGLAGDDTINGNDGNDWLVGNAGDDKLYGGSGDDLLDGGVGNDQLYGGTGDDRLIGGPGNDYIDGGVGTDTAVFSGVRNDYTVTQTATHSYQLVNNITGDRDTVIDVEKFEFLGNGTTADVVVNEADLLNRPPVFGTAPTLTVNETPWNAAFNGPVVVGTVTATDPDAANGDAVSSYAITGGNDGGHFAINASTGQITQVSAVDYETTPNHSVPLTITATDLRNGTTTQTFTVTVNDVNDPIHPVIAPATASVAENTANGTVLFTAHAVEDDAGQTVTYSLDDNAGGRFAINAATGVVTVANSALLDYETGLNTQNITIRATSSDATFTTTTSTITITDVNEAPILTADNNSVNEGNTVTGSVATNDRDPDAGQTATLAYALTGTVPAGLTLNSNGTYSFDANNPAYDHLKAGATQTVVANYTATDTGGLSSASTLTIVITGTNDAPVATAATAQATENGMVVTGQLVATDVDDGATRAFALNAPVAGLTINANGTYSFNPSNPAYDHLSEGAVQTITANYTVTDDQGATATSTLTITLTGTNDAPVAVADAFNVLEGASSVSGNVGTNDTDIDDDGANRTFTLNGTAPAGLTFSANGSYTFDPTNAAYDHLAAGVSQVLTVPYTVTDSHGATSTSTLTITITGTNDAPVASAATTAATEGGAAVTGQLVATDVDDGATRTFALNAPVAGLTLNANGTYSFDPTNTAYDHLAQGATQAVVATFTVTDNNGATATSTLTITVTGTNDAPVASAASVSATEGGATVIGQLVATDVDDGASRTFALNGAAPAGLTFNANGSYSFDPTNIAYDHLAQGASQVLTVPFTVTDDKGATATSTLTITVTGTNDAPVASAATTAATEGGAAVTGQLVATDVDDGATRTFALNAPVAGLTLNANGTYSFDPTNTAYDHLAAGAIQSVVANYTVTDDKGATSTSTLTITVTGTNDAPVASTANVTTVEGGATVNGQLVATDVDDGATRTFTLNGTAPAGLTFNANGSYSFDPSNTAYDHLALGAVQTLTVPFTVTDDKGATSTSTLTITVTGTNDAPVASAATTAATEGGAAATGQLVATDVDDGATRTFALAAPVAGLTLNANGTYSFDPTNTAYDHLAAGATQVVTANYTVTDNNGATGTSTLTITVTGTNDAPVATAANTAAIEGGAVVVGQLVATDVDDGATRTFTLAAPVAGLTLNANGSYSFDPTNTAYDHIAAGATQVVTANYTVTDDKGATATSTLTITVTGANDAPVATAANVAVLEGAAVVNGQLVATDVDDGATRTFSLNGTAPAGLTLNANGSYSFDPANTTYDHLAAGATQVLTVPYTVTDDHGAMATSTLTITVTGTNDAPVATAATATATEGGAVVSGQLVATDVDDGATRTFALNGAAPAGLTLNANGSYSFDPTNAAYDHLAAGATQAVVANYTVTDDKGATATSSLTITVTGTNDAVGTPSFISGNTGTPEISANGTVVGQVHATDVDDGSVVTYALTNNAGGRFAINATTGVVTVANGVLLDYEQSGANHGYSITVEAHSADGTVSTFNPFIAITDVNPEVVVGTGADETVVGGPGNDTFTMNGGNDVITGGLGNDRIDGGDGFDTAVFSYNLSQATSIVRSAPTSLVITGPDGTDTLTSIEALQFANGTVKLQSSNPYVDNLYYDQHYTDVLVSGADPATQYAQAGYAAGRNPNPFFSTIGYAAANPDEVAAGTNPLTSYSTVGYKEGRDPGANFDVTLYLLHNPDVAKAGIDPLYHYLNFGQYEGRATYAAIGSKIMANGFDPEYYLLNNPDVAKSGMDPYQHYLAFGAKEGRNPNAWFDDAGYLKANPDVAASGMDPLDHYHQFGWKEGRDPSAAFDTKAYLAANPDVAKSGLDPLFHFLQFGVYEMRDPHSDGVLHGKIDVIA